MTVITYISSFNPHNDPIGGDPLSPTHWEGPWGLGSLSDSPRVLWGRVAELDIEPSLAYPEAKIWTPALTSRKEGVFSAASQNSTTYIGKAPDSPGGLFSLKSPMNHTPLLWPFPQPEQHFQSFGDMFYPSVCRPLSPLVSQAAVLMGVSIMRLSWSGVHAVNIFAVLNIFFYFIDSKRSLLIGKQEHLLEHTYGWADTPACTHVHTHTGSVKRYDIKLTTAQIKNAMWNTQPSTKQVNKIPH